MSDLHGNALALEQVLARIASHGTDRIICLGDVATLGPEPERVLELLHESDALCILGNHDEFMLRPEIATDYTSIRVLIDAIDWCRARLSTGALDFVRSSVLAVDYPLAGFWPTLTLRAQPRSLADPRSRPDSALSVHSALRARVLSCDTAQLLTPGSECAKAAIIEGHTKMEPF